MPVHNGLPYLSLAISSVLDQTWRDLELIIIEDASTDNTKEYLRSLTDPRIVLVENETNLGITESLKKGVTNARGKYVARLDSDDIAHLDRLKIQVDFLASNPDYGLVASCTRIIDRDGKVLEIRNQYLDDLMLRWRMLFKNPVVHSTVMLRRKVLLERALTYDGAHGEDYRLWREVLRFSKGCVLENPLIDYRVHDLSWTQTKKSAQSESRKEQSYQAINKLLTESGKATLSWPEYQDLLAWTRSEPSDPSKRTIYVVQLLTLLRSFSKQYQGRAELKGVQRNVLGQVLRRARRQLILNPKIGLNWLSYYIHATF